LAGNWVTAIHRTADGVVWFGTQGGGVSGYDGIAWTSLDRRDGLAHNRIFSIDSDSDGDLWFGTYDGVAHYRRCSTPPLAHIVSITTDQTYRDLSIIPSFVAGTRVTVEYNAIDLKTLSDKRQYRVAIVEGVADSEFLQKDADNWLPPTRSTTFDYTFDKPGAYTIAVQAIDRDLNYSEPAVLSLTVQPDPMLVSMQAELNHLRREAGTKYHFENIIGRSAGIMQVRALIERAIDSGLTVLITGETGTGKELVAKAIHYNSPRKEHPLLDRSCGAIPKELLPSELFGHCRGAFTGAREDKMGLFEAASGGTVLLDEIGEMPQDTQLHLLRVLEERKVQRLGEHASRDVDVRIIAMTNRDLVREVSDGQFREDLYYRLSEFPIHIPPLRDRSEDIPLLAEHFLQEYSAEHKKELDGFAPGVLEMLQSYSWTGNVRELRNVVRRAAALAEEDEQIQTYHFPSQITQGESLIQEILSERTGLSASVERLQRRLVENALQECAGNRTQAAQILGIHRSALVRLMKRLGVK
jgi:transcriptional regulator with PAS, ATPase and Fis domain